MNRTFRALIGGAAVLCAAAPLFCAPARAQPLPRIKARVVSFDGHAMTLDLLPGPNGTAPQLSPAPKPGEPLTVEVLPQTRYAVTVRAALSDIKPGDYAGAAVTDAKGKLTARDVFLYPPDLSGTGEGRFSEGGRTMINGKVASVSASGFTLGYRGATDSSGTCMGRADPPAIAGPLGCTGSAAIAVPGGTPVTVLNPGDAGMIAPGVVVTVSMARSPQGGYLAPGVVIERPANVENPPPSP